MENRNVSFDKDTLNRLKIEFNNNTASVQDYEDLNEIMSALGYKDSIKNEFKKNNVWSFEMFILSRKNTTAHRDIFTEARLLGVLRGAIEFLMSKI